MSASLELWGQPWPALARYGARITCGAVPLQVDGALEGAWWYFRARSCHWQLGVSRTSADEAIEAACRARGLDVELAVEVGRWAATTGAWPCAGDDEGAHECLSMGFGDDDELEAASFLERQILATLPETYGRRR